LQDPLIDISTENCNDKSGVLIISDSASVVNFSTNVVQGLIWNQFICLNESLELSSAHNKVFISERIWDVPADGSELSSILHNSVEEGEPE